MREKRKKRILSIVCCILCILNIVMPSSVGASEIKKKTVRVGCAISTGYHKKDEQGNITGYGYDYEQALAQYAGWNIEYVEGSWNELQNMLQKGEIDLLGFLVKTKSREKIYDFAEVPSGDSMSCMVTRKDNKELTYENYEAFDSMKVAYQTGNANLESFQGYCDEHGFQVQLVPYATYEGVYQAIDNQEVDAGFLNNYQSLADYNMIAQLLPTNYYYAVKKGNSELLEEVNESISKIGIFIPNYEQELYNRYYSDTNLRSVMFTQEELDYLETNPTVEVVPACRERPYEYYNSDTGEYEGIIPDVLGEITALTGIEFSYVHDVNRWDYLSNHQGNVIGTITDDFDWAKEKNLDLTQPFIDSSAVILEKESTQGLNTVALCKQDFLNKCVEKYYSNWEITYYDTPKECVEAVLNGSSDCTLLNSYEAEYYVGMGKYQGLTELVIGDFDQDISFGISYQSDSQLYSILSKALLMINTDTYDSIIYYEMGRFKTESILDVVYAHPVEVLSIAVIIVVLLIVIIGLYFYAKSIHKKNLQIKLANRDRTDFFARMSHDMRTPMNGILGMLSIAEDEKDMDEVKSCIKKAKNSGQYMLSLINDTLDLQRLESGKMKLELQSIKGVKFIEEIVEMIQPSAKQKKLNLVIKEMKVDEEVTVKLDPVRVTQIFTNLLSNAIKFTPEGGTVEVMAECLGHEGNITHNVFKVKDTGIGMSENFIKNHMFKVYSQEHTDLTDKYAGSGLGLAIVKNLVDIMDGKIEVKSTLGEGTEYTIYLDFEMTKELPKQVEVVPSEEKKEQKFDELKGLHILLCEDHPLNAEIVQRLLKKVGCQVDWAKDGKQGLEMFEHSRVGEYDAILMDIRMPVMDGLEAARAIRGLRREDSNTIKIIAVTANAYDEDVKQSIEAGMNEHLSKPIEPRMLYQALTK